MRKKLISSSYTTETGTNSVTGKTTEVKKYAAPVFSVTVPAGLPFTINADGTVTTPGNLKIEIGSDWSFVPYSFTEKGEDWQTGPLAI